MKWSTMLNKRFLSEHLAAVMVFSIFLIIGLTIYDQYGVHWDEYNNQIFGNKWLTYIEKSYESGYLLELDIENKKGDRRFEIIPGSDPLKIEINNHDIIHGPIIEILLAFMSKKLLHIDDAKDIILMRHLSLFVLFFLSAILFYFLSITIFNHWGMGILGVLLLMLHPRIFSHSFYNTVDIAFLSFYLLSAYSLIVFIDKKTYSTAFFHAFACSLLISVRIAGIIVPLCTAIFFGLDFLLDSKKKRILSLSAFYLLMLAICTVVFWPFLWTDPFHHFIEAINQSKFVQNKYPGWAYNFKWIFFTTPVAYTFFFCVGLFAPLKSFVKGPLSCYAEFKKHLIIISLFLIPVILPIIVKSSLFDGWRHHYFVYPMFVLISLMGVRQVNHLTNSIKNPWGRKWLSNISIVILLASIIHVSIYIMKYFPHENVYSNIFTCKEKSTIKVRGSIDYWGLSYRHLLEYILKNDDGNSIFIGYHNKPAYNNLKILTLSERKRLQLVELNKWWRICKKRQQFLSPNYLITNYKKGIGSYDKFEALLASNNYKEFYSLNISGEKIASIFKLKKAGIRE